MSSAHHRKELTDYQKGEIEAHSHYISHAEIGRQLHIPRRTVSDFLQRLDEHQSSENLHRAGRPRKTSATADRWYVRNITLK